MRAVVIGIILASAGPSVASASTAADEIAVRAAQTHDQHCSAVEGTNRTDSARAISEVSAVLADVSESWEESQETFLLYWRGVLSACIGRDADAASDLAAFVEDTDPDGPLSSLRGDARRRMRRLDARGVSRTRVRAPGSPAAAIAITLGGSGGALAGLAVWQGSESERLRAAVYSGDVQRGEYPAHLQNEQDAFRAATTLGLSAVALGAAGAAIGIATAAAGSAREKRSGPVAFAPYVGPEGVSIQLWGRW